LAEGVLTRLINLGFNRLSMKFNPAIVILLLICIVPIAAFADASVGVKKGDWVEYQVSFTGNPPPEHDVVWARMEVIGVEGQQINATFVSQLENGTVLNVEEDLDFVTGKLIDMFIIPSGLNAGDTFYAQGVGEIVIDSVNVRSVAGASRTIMHAEAEDTKWSWDRATGVVVEARTETAMYTLDTVASSTGIWNPLIFGVDPALFYCIIILIAIFLAGIAIATRWKKHSRKNLK
jgi:hypothetical protein